MRTFITEHPFLFWYLLGALVMFIALIALYLHARPWRHYELLGRRKEITYDLLIVLAGTAGSWLTLIVALFILIWTKVFGQRI